MNTLEHPKTVLRFGECTLAKLDKIFNLTQVRTLAVLENWLAKQAEISQFERQVLVMYQEHLISNVHDWNEQELSLHFIGPLLSLVNFTTTRFNFFAQRNLSGQVGEIELRGEPDGMIARGKREPETPYFCFQEYKRYKDPDGDPDGQCLAAMLTAQSLNQTDRPIYGCFVLSRDWHFMVLQEREYAISEPYAATRDDIFEIFRILKALKQIITELI